MLRVKFYRINSWFAQLKRNLSIQSHREYIFMCLKKHRIGKVELPYTIFFNTFTVKRDDVFVFLLLACIKQTTIARATNLFLSSWNSQFILCKNFWGLFAKVITYFHVFIDGYSLSSHTYICIYISNARHLLMSPTYLTLSSSVRVHVCVDT